MAKNSNPPQNGGRSKIRLFVVDADLAPGELHELTSALTNAFRPVQVISRNAPARLSAGSNGGSIDEFDVEDLVVDDAVEDESGRDELEAPAASKSTKTRSQPRSPDVIDLDLNSDVSFVDFVAAHPAASVADKFLVVATWFKRHRNIDAIGIDHVYTCFLHPKLNWPTKMSDFDAPFRQHKKRKRMSRKSAGLYEINHIGMGEVDELSTGAGE